MIPGPGRSPGGGPDNPLQYSCLKDLLDRGAWWGTREEELQSSWSSILQALPSPSLSVYGPERAHPLHRPALRRAGYSPVWVQGRGTWMAFFPKEEGCGKGLTMGSPPPSRGDFSPLCSPPHPSPVHTHLPWKSPPKECCLSNPWGEMEVPSTPAGPQTN